MLSMVAVDSFQCHHITQGLSQWSGSCHACLYARGMVWKKVCVRAQGGQSRGQHAWVHGFPESVKSFITFVIISQMR